MSSVMPSRTPIACPHCGKPINPAALLGAVGGKAGKGKSKARSSEQARAAVLERWKKVKATNSRP